MGFLLGFFWSIVLWGFSVAYKLVMFVIKWAFHMMQLIGIKMSNKAAKDRMQIIATPPPSFSERSKPIAASEIKSQAPTLDKERRTSKSMVQIERKVIYK